MATQKVKKVKTTFDDGKLIMLDDDTFLQTHYQGVERFENANPLVYPQGIPPLPYGAFAQSYEGVTRLHGRYFGDESKGWLAPPLVELAPFKP